MAEYQHIEHGFEPVFDGRSRVLVLGSFPSVLSRANAFFYGNPQNRFWRVIAACVGEPVPPNEGEQPVGGHRGLAEEHGGAVDSPVVAEECGGASGDPGTAGERGGAVDDPEVAGRCGGASGNVEAAGEPGAAAGGSRASGVGAALRPAILEESIAAKRALLLRHGIALWDVIESCDIKGSSDASIRNVVPAHIERITDAAPIERVLCNGGTAGRLYHRYLEERTGLAATVLPSTSPANASWSLERLIARWREELAGL